MVEATVNRAGEEFQMGLFKAQSIMSNKANLFRAAKDIPFMSLSNLITALLSEIRKKYVLGTSFHD